LPRPGLSQAAAEVRADRSINSVPLPGPPHSRAQEPHSLKNGCAALALPLPKGKYTIEVCFDVANALSHNSD
tara:strand:- start:5226 stop:5441 length:216 start_codon:yes stop_codon:yes gene_type:complete